MKMLKKVSGFFGTKTGMMLTSLALMIGVSSVNDACILWWHQPQVPQGMEKFKKH